MLEGFQGSTMMEGLLKPSHHSAVVLEGFQGPTMMPTDASLSDSCVDRDSFSSLDETYFWYGFRVYFCKLIIAFFNYMFLINKFY